MEHKLVGRGEASIGWAEPAGSGSLAADGNHLVLGCDDLVSAGGEIEPVLLAGMVEAVVADLMAFGMEAPQQVWVLGRPPAHHEEGRLLVVPGQQVTQPVGDSRLRAVVKAEQTHIRGQEAAPVGPGALFQKRAQPLPIAPGLLQQSHISRPGAGMADMPDGLAQIEES